MFIHGWTTRLNWTKLTCWKSNTKWRARLNSEEKKKSSSRVKMKVKKATICLSEFWKLNNRNVKSVAAFSPCFARFLYHHWPWCTWHPSSVFPFTPSNELQPDHFDCWLICWSLSPWIIQCENGGTKQRNDKTHIYNFIKICGDVFTFFVWSDKHFKTWSNYVLLHVIQRKQKWRTVEQELE